MNRMKWTACFLAMILMVCASSAQQPSAQPTPTPAQKSQKSKPKKKKKNSASSTAKTDQGQTQSATTAETPKPIPGLSSSNTSAEPGLQSVLSQMDAAADRFRYAQADLTSDQYQKVVDETDTQKGRIYFRRTSKELQMAINITGPETKYVLLTDSKIRLYQPKIDQVTEYALGKNRAEAEGMFALGFGGRGHDLLKSFDVKLAGSEMVDGVKTIKLELTPKTDRLKNMFSRIDLWIDPALGVSRRQQFWEPSGDYRLARYSNIELNQKISDDTFKLKTTSHTKTVTP